MKEPLVRITERLVDNPDRVSGVVKVGASAMIFELAVDEKDVGQVIGKRGNTVGAIRKIMTSLGGKHGKRVYAEVQE